MTDEEKMKAMRAARTIASDLSLYNEAKIIQGIEQDTFFDVLKDEIEEAREYYRGRVSTEIFRGTNYFERALVDVVLKPKARIKSKIW